MLIPRFPIAALASLAVLSGCATLPGDHGLGDVRGLVTERTGQVLSAPDVDTPALIAELLAQTLTAHNAVQVALLNNPRVRAEYARLGLAAAEVYNAGRLSNPRFGAAVMSSDEAGSANQVTLGLAQSFTDLLLLPSRGRLAKGDFERIKHEVSAAIIELAADAETAYFRLVGANQVAAMRAHVARAAQVSADLAQRFLDAGNLNTLELTQAQSAASQARLTAMQATADTMAARNALNRLMGLPGGGDSWTTPDQLQLPVAQEDELDALLRLARQSRLDLAAKHAQVALLADSLGVTRKFRYVGDIELGVETERETDRSRITGPRLSIELPIFNSGAGRVTRAQALVEGAEAELRALELAVGNDVQLAHARVQAARSMAGLYRDALIPQREAVVLQTQQEVNYMLKGQFELLLAKQQEFDAYQGYLETLRDYWIARTELARAVGAQLPSGASVGPETVGPTLLPDNSSPGMHHGHHTTDPHTNHGVR